MTDELVSRDALRELLFDEVTPPPGSEAMFAATFAATGPDGADLLPPDALFDVDPAAEDPADPALDDLPLDDLPADDPALDDPDVPPDVSGDVPAGDGEHHAEETDPASEHAADPDPGTGW
jgi:hypothetical protein